MRHQSLRKSGTFHPNVFHSDRDNPKKYCANQLRAKSCSQSLAGVVTLVLGGIKSRVCVYSSSTNLQHIRPKTRPPPMSHAIVHVYVTILERYRGVTNRKDENY